ncbi:MAG: hypothetical protein JWL72_983 [Ilumatobacteraceae bacterium]|nr:hypothetical protein [Ilumatobacteraceae bacterium]MCU1387645.1 hypothetical protein [Ilumatobacteraceae bacterium]
MQIQRSADHRIVPWANGLGVTADLFLWPPDAGVWMWRLSIADVTDDVPFSVMPGIDRHITVAQGAGMTLTIDGAPPVRMDRTSPPLSFDGESTTTCRLLDGPIADLNLMVRRGMHVGSLRLEPLAAGQTLTTVVDDVAVVVLDGSVRVAHEDLQPFDAVRLAGEATAFEAGPTSLCAVASVRSI